MNIVGVSACSAGIAHTYIVKEKLEKIAKLMGHTCKIETQGSIGVEDELTAAEIAAAVPAGPPPATITSYLPQTGVCSSSRIILSMIISSSFSSEITL